MARLVEIPLDDGSSLFVETDDRAGPVVRGGGGGDSVIKAATSVQTAMDGVGPAAQAIVERLRRDDGLGPSEVVLEFGLVVRAEAGLVISKAGGEANFSVRVTWTRPE